MQNAGHASQSALARASDVPQSTIARLLKGTGTQGPESATVQKLAQACGVTFDWLLHGYAGSRMEQVKLTDRQAKWLALLDSLGSEDIAEFTALIAARQERNRRLLSELCHETERRTSQM
jgi:transcriptional regulator with XRE-family HTH domain